MKKAADGEVAALYTVFVVDDQPEFLEMTRDLLSCDARIKIVGGALSGEEAIVLLPALRPEVAVLDVQMPGLNGFETARRLLRFCSGLRIVMMSSFDDPEYESLAKATGAVAFLPKKDLSPEALLGLLRKSA